MSDFQFRSQAPSVHLESSNMADNGGKEHSLRLYISNLIRINRRRRLNMQVAVNHLLARRRRLLGVSLVLLLLLSARNIVTHVPRPRSCILKLFPHFKQLYFVREKQELHIFSFSAIFLLQMRLPRMAFREKWRIVGKT